MPNPRKKGIINWYQFYLSRRGSDVHSSIFRFHPEEWFTPCHFTPEGGPKVIHAAGKGPGVADGIRKERTRKGAGGSI